MAEEQQGGSDRDEAGAAEPGRLVPCPDCGTEVSRLAVACPRCARPMTPPAAQGPAPREGLFLRTLNVGCVMLFVAIVGFIVLLVGLYILGTAGGS